MGKVADANLPQMDCWLSWWHVRYPRWKKMFVAIRSGKPYRHERVQRQKHLFLTLIFLQEVENISFVPTTNLSESKHASWLASVGNKQLLNVYDACVSDLANALLQSAKMDVHGRFLSAIV